MCILWDLGSSFFSGEGESVIEGWVTAVVAATSSPCGPAFRWLVVLGGGFYAAGAEILGSVFLLHAVCRKC